MTNTRHIPEGYKEYKPDIEYPENLFACYVNLERPHKPRARFYIGRQSSPAWNYIFFDIERMKEKINDSISNLMRHEDLKAKRKTERSEAKKNMDTSKVQVGDIYHWSGGYNCTKNAYIKVIEVVGKNKFKVVKLGSYQVSGDWMNGEVAPVVDGGGNITFIATARPSYRGDIALRNTKDRYHTDFYKWNGKPNWENCD